MTVAPAEPLLVGGLVLAAFLPVPFALGYHAESDVARYFLTSFWLLAAFAAVGASRAAAIFSGRRSQAVTWGAFVVLAACVVAVTLVNRDFFDQRDEREGAQYVDRIIAATPARAIVIASWSYATPLAYAAYVERRMQQRIVETAWVGDDEKYLKGWIHEYPVYVIAPTMPVVKGIRFTVVDGHDPMVLRATQ